MGILGITNRTENWKTIQHFAPFVRDGNIRLNLARRLGEGSETQPSDVCIELFWYGMRDYVHKQGRANAPTYEELAGLYNHRFLSLRKNIDRFGKFQALKHHNYDVSEQGRMDKLKSNLAHTEIDIVLETPKHLFIGEAKGETKLRGVGERVLVHQLIRQYVMAIILVDCQVANGHPKKRVIPFVVGDKASLPSLKNTAQIKFMIHQTWLKEKNVLSWDRIKELAQPGV